MCLKHGRCLKQLIFELAFEIAAKMRFEVESGWGGRRLNIYESSSNFVDVFNINLFEIHWRQIFSSENLQEVSMCCFGFSFHALDGSKTLKRGRNSSIEFENAFYFKPHILAAVARWQGSSWIVISTNLLSPPLKWLLTSVLHSNWIWLDEVEQLRWSWVQMKFKC